MSLSVAIGEGPLTTPKSVPSRYNRQRHAAARVVLAASEPALQIEHRRVGRQTPADQLADLRYQLIMATGDAFDPKEIAVAKIFDPRGVQGPHRCRRVAVLKIF